MRQMSKYGSNVVAGRLITSGLAIGLIGIAAGCSCSSDGDGAGAGGGAAIGGAAGIAGLGGTGGFSGSAGSGGASGGGAGGVGGTETCAEATITATNAIPTVWLLLDGSSSMQQGYGNSTRWRALREALVGPQGVLRTLDDRINFGMAIYAGEYVDGPQGTCPIPGTPIAPTMSAAVFDECDSGSCAVVGTTAGQNFNQIAMGLPNDQSPGRFTPSGEALNWLYDQLGTGILEPDGERAPIYVIFATDGEPNGCSGGGNGPTFGMSETAIARGVDLGVTTYVVSLAQGNDLSDEFAAHLQRLANLGAGLAETAAPGATLYSPQDPEALAMDLETLLSATLGCSVPLRGTVDPDLACSGTVTLNGVPLACNGDDGWSVDSTGRTLTLSGTACQTFKNSAAVMVQARFPCNVLRPD